jgi:predicted amidohydrolase YtcJ
MVRGFVNARVYQSFAPLRMAEAFVVAGGRIIYIGDTDTVENIVRILGGEIIDLHRGVVLPGFIDAHMHLLSLGIQLNSLDLRGVASIEDLKKILKDFASRSRMKWIVGRGWDQELFKEKRFPTRWDLDEVISDRPVYISRVCGHVAVVNTVAMEMLGFENIRDSNILRDGRGVATGLIREGMVSVAWQKILSDMPSEDLAKSVLDALKYAASQGVTTIDVAGCDLRELTIILNLWSMGLLPLRVRIHMYTEVFKMLREAGVRPPFGDEHLKIIGVKLVVDGSLGARTAWLSKHYSDDPQNMGVCITPPEVLEAIALDADSIGLQLAAHAIGDRALDVVLLVYSKLSLKRHRVEHASLVRDDQLAVLEKLKPVLVVQPHFVISDWWVLNRVSIERSRWVYRFKDFIDRGIPVAFSTDSPVESLNPWETVYAAVTRGRYEEVPLYSYTKDQAIPVNMALHMYTYGSAYALNEENNLGSLEVGKLADFIVVDRDPLSVDPRELRSIRVLETYVSGKRVWP